MSGPEDGEEGYKTRSSGCGRAVPLTDAQQLWLPVRELHGVKPTRSGGTAPSSPDWAQWATEKREDLKWGGGCVLVLEGSVGGAVGMNTSKIHWLQVENCPRINGKIFYLNNKDNK